MKIRKIVIFVENAECEKTIVHKLKEIALVDFDVVACREPTSCWVGDYLDRNRESISDFAIITFNKNEDFRKNYPNNTVEVPEEDVDWGKVGKHIRYITSNFGREYGNPGEVFFTSDTHFWHTNIIKYCERPWSSVEEMNEGLIERWNSVVGKDDRVIHLGDFCFGGRSKVESVFSKLNGRIDIVLGNHDRLKIKDYYDIGFHRVYDRPVVYDNFFILSHAPLQGVFDNTPFANIFGHVHNMPMYKTWTKNSCCVCVERHDYKPIRFRDLKENLVSMNESI